MSQGTLSAIVKIHMLSVIHAQAAKTIMFVVFAPILRNMEN